MKRAFVTVVVTHMFIEVFFLIHIALLPTFIKEFNLNVFQASLIVTLPSLAVILSYIPAGLLADRVGAKPMLLLSVIIEGIAALFISQIRDYAFLVVAMSLIKVSSPIYHTSGLSAISRLSKPGSVSKMIGLHNALGSLGATIGLFSLSILVGNIGWRFVYLLWSIPTLVWCVAILSYEEDRVVKSAKRTNVMDLKSVLNFKFALLLSMIAFRDFGASAITTFITTYMVNVRGLSQEVASMVFGLGPLIGVLSSIMGGYLSSRFGDAKTLFWMMVCSVFSLILLITTEGLGLLLHTYLLYSFFNNSVWSPIGSLVAALTQSSKRGAGYSIYFFVEGTVTTIQPLITAVAINYTSFYVIFPIGIGFTSICAVLLGCFYQYFKSP